jgi:hypothetical protein
VWVAGAPFNVAFRTGSIGHDRLTILPFSLHNCPVFFFKGECANEGCRLLGIADTPEEKRVGPLKKIPKYWNHSVVRHVYKVNMFIRAIRCYRMKNLSLYRLLKLPSIWHLFLLKNADVNLCSCGTIGAPEGLNASVKHLHRTRHQGICTFKMRLAQVFPSFFRKNRCFALKSPCLW